MKLLNVISRSIKIILLISCIFQLHAAVYKTIYVSPSGDNSDGSSWVKAKQTIQAAMGEVRNWNSGMTGDIHVVIEEGTYYEKLEFTPGDGGKNGCSIIYRNKPGKEVFISGGELINNPNWVLGADGAYYSSPGHGSDFRHIYFDGQRRTAARSKWYKHDAKIDSADHTITISKDSLPSWPWDSFSNQPVTINIMMKWCTHHLEIDSINVVGNDAIIFPKNRMNWSVDPIWIPFDHSYCFSNSTNFWSPGDYFADPNDGKIGYYPKSASDIPSNYTAIVKPVHENIVTLIGVDGGDKVRNIRFHGLQFVHSNIENPPGFRFTGWQASDFFTDIANFPHRNKDHLTGAVHVESARNIDFEFCAFKNLAGDGLVLYHDVEDCFINGNLFQEIGGGGISLHTKRAFDWEKTSLTDVKGQRIVITNNTIDSTGLDFPGTCGIWVAYGRWNVIKRNTVRNLPYTGISLGWGWGRDASALIRGNLIHANHIHNVVNLMADGGGVYTLEDQDDDGGSFDDKTWIYQNYVHHLARNSVAHVPAPIAAYYFDNGSADITVNFNVSHDISETLDFYSNPPLHFSMIDSSGNSNNDPIIMAYAGAKGIYENYSTPGSYEETFDIAPLVPTVVSSSLGKDFVELRATDNEFSTMWASAPGGPEPNPYLFLDFIREFEISEVQIISSGTPENARKNFEIQGSDDPNFNTFTILGSQGSAAFPDGATWVAQVSNQDPFRYFRVVKTDGAEFNISELKVFVKKSKSIFNIVPPIITPLLLKQIPADLKPQ